MYNVLLTLQILITISCMVSVLIVAFQKPSTYSNVIIMTFMCGFVQNAGYILEMTAKDVNQGIIAVKAEYLGGTFLICLLTFFMFKYCGHEFNNWLKGFLIFEGVFVLFGVLSWEVTHMYYTAVDFVETGIIPHLVITHGWLYYLFTVTTVIEFVACIFIIMVSIMKTTQEHMKFNYYVLILVVLVPLIGFVLSVSGVLDGYDCTPFSVGIGITIFAVAIGRKRVFNVADAVSEIIISDMENAVVIKNAEDGFEYANKKATELFPVLAKYSRGEIIKDVEIKKLFDKSRESSVKFGKSNYEVSINDVIAHDEIIGTTAILFDVTESNKQIEQIKKLMKEAEDANRAKTAFLSNISNEIRTPINIIMGMSEVLLRDFSNAETKEYLVNIKNSSTTLTNLINDILDFSRIESGRLELKGTRFDIQKMIKELISIYEFRSKQKNISFKFEIAKDIPKFLLGDELRVKQVLSTLLSNAVKYTDNGGVKFRIGFKYRSDYDIDLIIAIEDTGRGIEHKDLDSVFNSFVTEDNQSTDGDGTGIGLSITKQIVELMGGIINLKSQVGTGSVFSIVIPLKCTSDNSETVGEIVGLSENESMYQLHFTAPDARILIIDDSKISLMVTKKLLSKITPNIVTATSGQEGLDIVENDRFDFIFIDHRMPGMDGIETLSRMRQIEGKCEGIPIVVNTAESSPVAKEYYHSRGFTDYIEKPATLEQLANIIYKYLPERLIVLRDISI